jgi:CHAD domain-containing protein
MAKAREIAGLGSGDRFGDVAARVVRTRVDELLEHSEGVLETTDIERVHAMRVASRRLRAAMEVFAPCFPRKPFKKVLKEVKELADALGERRDRDVSIAALRDFGAALSDGDRRGVLMMVEQLAEEQSLANQRLAPVVERPRLERLRARIEELTAAAERGTA